MNVAFFTDENHVIQALGFYFFLQKSLNSNSTWETAAGIGLFVLMSMFFVCVTLKCHPFPP